MRRFVALLSFITVLIVGGWLHADAVATPAPAAATAEVDATGVKKGNRTEGRDLDEVITNNLMRAQTGSKSKISLASSLSYYGGSVNDPFSEHRPNLTGANGITPVSLLTGGISTKYNFDQFHSLYGGVGVRWITPLNGTQVPAGYLGQKYDFDNPYLTYQYVYKWSGIQSVLTAGPTFYTQTNLKALGYVSSAAVAQNNIYEIGHSGLSVGSSFLAGGGVFNKSGLTSKGKSVLLYQSDYIFGVYPFLEYKLTSRLNLRTLVGASFEHHRSYAAATTFKKNKVYESIGLGVSVTRDIFLYPNVQFIPDELRPSQTNVGISANINVF